MNRILTSKVCFGFVACCNPVTLALIFSKDGRLSLPNIFLISLFDLYALSFGIILYRTSEPRRMFKAVFKLTTLLALVFLGLGIGETHLTLHPDLIEDMETENRIYPHRKAYAAFAPLHLHPQYFFFSVPLDKGKLKDMNNDVCSVDERGIRGPLPEERGKKKLALLLGGSAAFGKGSSSNATTITGYLNRMQDDILFVNMGVPSWVSQQELYRMALEIPRLKPDLVIAYNGFNDVAYDFSHRNHDFPLGTPGVFETLSEKVDDIKRQDVFRLDLKQLKFRLFPNLVRYVDLTLNPETFQEGPLPPLPELDDTLKKRKVDIATTYIEHMDMMRRIADSHGIRFKVIWQPDFYHHQHTTSLSKRIQKVDSRGLFVRYLLSVREEVMSLKKSFELHDFSNIFDSHFDEVKLKDIFVDEVHVSDRANEIVAGEILRRVLNP